MWLDVFYENYSRAARKYYGCDLKPLAVQRDLSSMRGATLNIAGVIRALANRTDWNYRKWWPQPSDLDLEAAIRIPDNLSPEGARKQAVELLYERLKNIECVSVILRFLYPEHFGIISFPVTSLINLPQARNATTHYLQYLKNLREIRRDCGSGQLIRMSDLDMALWSAAQFAKDSDSASESTAVRQATEDMWRDEKFQELRFRNSLQELRMDKKPSVYLAFARVLCAHDPRVASVIVALVFKSLVHEIGCLLGLQPAESSQRTTGVLVRDIDRSGVLRRYGVERGQLQDWWALRKQAVHQRPEPISDEGAQTFAAGAGRLLGITSKIRQSRAVHTLGLTR